MVRVAKILFVFGIITLLFTVYNAFTYYAPLSNISTAIRDHFIITTILWVGVSAVQFAVAGLMEDYEKFKLIVELKDKGRKQ
jgi:hypothetical protein